MTARPQYPFVREPDTGDLVSDMVVDISEPNMPQLHDGAMITSLDNGDIEVDFDGGTGQAPLDPSTAPFYANLAEYLTETELDMVGQLVCEAVEVDLESRSDWLQRFRKGMELLGVVESSANLGVLRHAKEVTHPLIAEALVQYQARAIAEHFPPEGPVKSIVLGKSTPEREEQAERASGYMNYQLTVEDRTYFTETDQGYFLVGMEGSVFNKAYHDELTGQNLSRMVMARDFIVPYSATSLETAIRYTHILPYSQNDVRKLMVNGFYREVELDIPTGEPAKGHEPVIRAQDDLEGKQPSDQIEDDRPHLVYEQHVDWDLPGFEDRDQQGQETGVKLPYIVHVDRDTQRVLAIYRNWKEKDLKRRKRVRFAHKKFLPGPGFYGLGLVHVIGGLGAAATGILRLMLVTSALAGAGGGFKTKEGAKIAGSIEIEPGVWKDVSDLTYDELKKAFYQPDFKGPTEALFKVLALVVEGGKSFSSTTEAMTGEGPATGPVGTMVALIEQGSKVYSGIHLRCHMAATEEFRLLAELNGEYLPDEYDGGYPYAVPGADQMVFAEDFDDRVDIVPVSDPNIFSATQRIAVNQSVMQLASENPGEIDRSKAVRRMLSALRVPDIDELLIKKEIPRYDPVTENAMLMLGKPVRAYPDQDHGSHMVVLSQVLQDKQQPDPVKAAAAAHYAEHQALKWMAEVSQMLKLPQAIPLDLGAEQGEPVGPVLPPQVEKMVSQRAAMALNQLRPPQPSPEEQEVQGDLKIKQMKAQGELKVRQMKEQGELKILAWKAKAEASIKLASAKLNAAVERQTGMARLAHDREMGIRGIEQDGRLADAKQQREAMVQERGQADSDVQKAVAELEQAIKDLSSGLESVVQIVDQRTGGADAGNQSV